MVKTIWKFPFDTADTVTIKMPTHSKVLTVQTQHGQPCLWAIVDPHAPQKETSFRVYGTGHPLPTYGPDETVTGRYVGTYQQLEGDLVFHMFQMGGPQ